MLIETVKEECLPGTLCLCRTKKGRASPWCVSQPDAVGIYCSKNLGIGAELSLASGGSLRLKQVCFKPSLNLIST